MTNTSAKGAAVERKAIAILERNGWKVHRCVRTGSLRGGRWVSISNDVFGCVDIIAKRPGFRTRWIQVTAHSGIGEKVKDLEEVPWDNAFDSVEIWRWVGGRRGIHPVTMQPTGQYFEVYSRANFYQLTGERVPAVAKG